MVYTYPFHHGNNNIPREEVQAQLFATGARNGCSLKLLPSCAVDVFSSEMIAPELNIFHDDDDDDGDDDDDEFRSA
ncbi:hypothetical protein I7I50_06669 [Histoplasma capsulatum G186AR]|nr:hypothetical protein I7I52_10257 [Histoplasma capsulatum]QSS67552.1 hypothetical protein I7I50_06669 [Histoplasma capsulatum G186AR]